VYVPCQDKLKAPGISQLPCTVNNKQNSRYLAPDKLSMCEKNRSLKGGSGQRDLPLFIGTKQCYLDLPFDTCFKDTIGCIYSDGIANNLLEFDNWTSLHKSVILILSVLRFSTKFNVR